MAPAPLHSPPARPLTRSGGSGRHGKKKEEQGQKQKQDPSLFRGQIPFPQERDLTPTPRRSDRFHPRMAWIYCRHREPVEGGEVSDGGVSAAWMPRPSPQGFTASPPSDTSPPPHAETQSRFGFGVEVAGQRPALPQVQGAALPNTLRCACRPAAGTTHNEKAAFRRLFHYFSLISRRRSSRKPWAVIGSGYRLGFSGVMHEGSTSIRKSGFGCRKNGTE